MSLVKTIFGNWYFYLFLLVFGLSSYGLSVYKEASISEYFGIFIIFFIFFGSVMWIITYRVKRKELNIRSPKREAWFFVLYFFGWLLLNLFLWKFFFKQSNWLSAGLDQWGLLVAVPMIILLLRGYRPRDIGISFPNAWQNLRVALLAMIVIGGFMILMTPGGKLIRSGEIETGRLIRLFSVSFGYALIFAAIFEEFFFRAVLQSRLAKALNSELSGLLIASFLFGLYHLPFQYYGDGAASGDLGFSLSTVLNEQMISGPFLGILWLRTKNLFAPIMVHALIDAISLMPQLV